VNSARAAARGASQECQRLADSPRCAAPCIRPGRVRAHQTDIPDDGLGRQPSSTAKRVRCAMAGDGAPDGGESIRLVRRGRGDHVPMAGLCGGTVRTRRLEVGLGAGNPAHRLGSRGADCLRACCCGDVGTQESRPDLPDICLAAAARSALESAFHDPGDHLSADKDEHHQQR
jgi:hypothetical protein